MMVDHDTESLLDKLPVCKVSRPWKIALLVITLLVWLSGPVNMYFISYYSDKNNDVYVVFLALLTISLPFCLFLPVVTLYVWGKWGQNVI